jgi:methionine-rich copper-binding protein CopC
MLTRQILTLASSLALLAVSSHAFAHAMLKKATPAVGGTVNASPSEIKINFSEGVEPKFSGLTLASQAGGSVPVGKSSVDPSDNTTLITPISQPLKPGVYTVNWHAVATDTHKTQGSFQFTVKP